MLLNVLAYLDLVPLVVATAVIFGGYTVAGARYFATVRAHRELVGSTWVQSLVSTGTELENTFTVHTKAPWFRLSEVTFKTCGVIGIVLGIASLLGR